MHHSALFSSMTLRLRPPIWRRVFEDALSLGKVLFIGASLNKGSGRAVKDQTGLVVGTRRPQGPQGDH
jgi:hypothetical protein